MEDIAQEVACLLVRGSQGEGYQPGPWLDQVVLRCALEYEREQLELLPLAAEDLAVEPVESDCFERDRIHAALQRLPLREQNAVCLCDEYCFEAKQAARFLKVSPGHVQLLRHRGRRKMRTWLGVEGTKPRKKSG